VFFLFFPLLLKEVAMRRSFFFVPTH
jgi:hypothetical protein